MNDTAFLGLVYNAALLLSLALVFDLASLRWGTWQSSVRQVVIGIILGAIGIAVMLTPWHFAPGIIFDTRSVLLGISGLFFGTIPTLILMGMTATVRLYMGGTAAAAGAGVIITTGLIGIAWRRMRRRPLTEISGKELYLFGIVIHLDMLALMLTLPWPTAVSVLSKITLPVLIIYPVGTALLGTLMVSRLRRDATTEALKTNEQNFRAIADYTAGWEMWYGPEGRLRWINPSVERLTGYNVRECLNHPDYPWFMIHPDDRQELRRLAEEELRSSNNGRELEFRYIRKDGATRWGAKTWQLIYDDAGRPLGCRVSVRDITERMQIEEALRESEARYRELVENANSIIIRMNRDGKFTYFNEFAQRFFGYEPGEIVGQSAVGTIVPETESSGRDLRAMILDVVAFPERYATNINENILRDGTRVWILWTNKPLFEATGQVREILCVGSDITERIKAEKETEKLQSQLVQAQKMESVGRLAGGVAHDFNNMLTVILGNLAMMMEELPPGNPLRENLEEIQKCAQRSAELTRQLLAFARKQAVVPKVLDLNSTVEGMLMMLRRLIGEDIELVWLPGANLWPVKIDPSQIDQVLANLCVNARDAIGGVGKVTIETGTATFDEAHVSDHSDTMSGEYVLLAISDNGCGMDKEVLGHIFEPFFTTKEVGQGTGLGLATVYGIVKQNQGFIIASSEPGCGTTFKLYLPRHAAEAAQAHEHGPAQPAVCGHETILLVEDEPSILMVGRRVIESLGYKVLTAGTPGEALQLARQHGDEIQLLLTDVVMPEMNGRELAKQILALYPGIKHLYMSGYTADVIAHHGVLNEDIHFIQKPFSKQDLAEKLREALMD